MNSRMKHLKRSRMSILLSLLILLLYFSQNLFAQRTIQNTYFHSFLHPKFADGNYHKIGVYASMEELVVNTDSKIGYISPNFNHTASFRFNNLGDKEFQDKIIEGMKEELTKLGYEVVILNPLVQGESISLENLIDIGKSQLCGAVCIIHYNVYRQWKISTDKPSNSFWMAMDEDTELDKTRQKNYAGFLIIPNLYVYDILMKEFVYRGLNYGNNGSDNGGFYLSDQSDPFWKKNAAERVTKTIFHYSGSGICTKYPEWEYQSIPKVEDKSFDASQSLSDEHDFWLRSMNISPYTGIFPVEIGVTLTKAWDPGTHISDQLNFTFAQTQFKSDATVYGLYISYEFGFKSSSRNLERFTMSAGPICGFGIGNEQTYEVTNWGNPWVGNYETSRTSRTGRFLLAVSFHAEYLISRSLAIGLRVIPGIDAHFYYLNKVIINPGDSFDKRNEENGVPQSVGIPVQLHFTWYYK